MTQKRHLKKNLSLFPIKSINKYTNIRKLPQHKKGKVFKIHKLALYEKGKTESFLPKVRNKNNLPVLPCLLTHCTESSIQSNWKRKIHKRYSYWKIKIETKSIHR